MKLTQDHVLWSAFVLAVLNLLIPLPEGVTYILGKQLERIGWWMKLAQVVSIGWL
jgi:hypothetical protein